MKNVNLRFAVVTLLFLLGMAGAANAQSAAFASITGRVTDPQGAVVPKVTVTAKNSATGLERSAVTTGAGSYTIATLPPGGYEVRAESAGFGQGIVNNVQLQVGDQRDVDFKLSVANATTTVEVTGQVPLIETTRTSVSTSVTDVDISRLPVLTNPTGLTGISNDYAQLALTAPGVRLDTSTVLNDLVGPGAFNSRGNLYNVDGGNITDQSVTSRDQLGASVDEVKEFQVLTNNYNAEYGQATGIILNAVTKSGSNSFHGDGHMYFRGRNLRSADPFYNNNLFQNAKPGDGSCPLNDFIGTTLVSDDGCRRAPFHKKEGGFTIGGPIWKDHTFFFGSFENTRQGLPLQLTAPGRSVLVDQPSRELLYSGKIDHQLTRNNLLSVRYNVQRDITSNVIVQTSNNITPNDLTDQVNHDSALNVGVVSTITPNLVNEARFFFHRTLGPETVDKTTLPGQVHATFSSGANFCCPQGGLNKRYQYIDNLTWTRGSHTFKSGFNISYYPFFSLFQQFHFGQYSEFDSTDTVPGSFTIGFGSGTVRTKDNIYGFYGQDTWKVTRKLTLNYGLRWDAEAGAFKGGTVAHNGSSCFQGNGLISACSSDYNNFQPRFGFTYAPWEGTLIKGAFGEMTELAYLNIALDSLNFDGTNLNTVTISPSTQPAALATQVAAVLGQFPNTPTAASLAFFAPTPGTLPSNFGRVRPISNHLKNPEVREVNFGIQHEFGKTFVSEIQYVGSFGFGEFGERDVNTPPIIPDPAHPGFFYLGRRPNPLFGGAIRLQENSRTSHYNGLVVSGTKRLSSHVAFQGSYTWSKTLTSGEDFFGLSEPADLRNIRAELGPAYNDIRHAANFGVNFDTDRLIGGGGFLSHIVNGFVFGVTGQLQSGRPYPVSTGVGVNTTTRFFGAGNETNQRPSVLPDGTIVATNIGSSGGQNLSISPNGFAACAALLGAAACPQPTTFVAPAGAIGATDSFAGLSTFAGSSVNDFQAISGNLGRNAGRGSPFYRTDLSIRKQFHPLGRYEQLQLELVGEFFNIFNHPNFQGFNTNDVVAALAVAQPGDPNFANCTSCINPFTGQYIGASGQVLHIQDLQHGKISRNLLNPVFGGLGDPATTELPRQIQLSFRVRF